MVFRLRDACSLPRYSTACVALKRPRRRIPLPSVCVPSPSTRSTFRVQCCRMPVSAEQHSCALVKHQTTLRIGRARPRRSPGRKSGMSKKHREKRQSWRDYQASVIGRSSSPPFCAWYEHGATCQVTTSLREVLMIAGPPGSSTWRVPHIMRQYARRRSFSSGAWQLLRQSHLERRIGGHAWSPSKVLTRETFAEKDQQEANLEARSKHFLERGER